MLSKLSRLSLLSVFCLLLCGSFGCEVMVGDGDGTGNMNDGGTDGGDGGTDNGDGGDGDGNGDGDGDGGDGDGAGSGSF
ncbi:MAG: hypothetical protein ACPGXK_06610, partial [Phycisphaerae bacterium]